MLGLDPSMANTGMCWGNYLLDERTFMPEGLELIETKPGTDKKVRKSSVDFDRCRKLLHGVRTVCREEGIQYAFAELPTGSQNAVAMKGYGVSICVMASLPVPVVQVTPREVKVAALDRATASKEDMIIWATTRWPHLPFLTRTLHGQQVYVNKNEHLADALAAVEAGLVTDQWNQALAAIQAVTGD